jgi:hypothetical protein
MTGLEKLREIGVEKIHDQTHIARKFVEDILNEKYFSMNKIQFAGFISIIERDYNMDLHELIEAYNARLKKENTEEDEPFVVSAQESEKQEKKKGIYLVGALAAAGIFLAIFALSSAVDEEPLHQAPVLKIESEVTDSEINNSTIEEAKTNLTQLGNGSDAIEVEELNATVEPVIEISKFEIIPQSNLWIGIVDLDTFERTQKLTSSPFELAADKEWLLVMGHGFVYFDVNGEEMRFKDEKKVWFAYENGTLTKLSRREFKEKNRGNAW